MTATRFLNAHLFDPSQSIDGIGYMDIAGGVITAINLGTPPKDNKIEENAARATLEFTEYLKKFIITKKKGNAHIIIDNNISFFLDKIS